MARSAQDQTESTGSASAHRARLVRLAEEFRAAFKDLVDRWFPTIVDREHGGFLCDFDHRWRSNGAHPKMLEYQTRATISAAVAAAVHPEQPELGEYAARGLAFLRETMWDPEYGGLYRMLDRDGTPREGSTKHTHGTSYAIMAAVACHKLGGGSNALDFARQIFTWIDDHAYDPENGGYFGLLARDGKVIRSADESPPDFPIRDALGTPLGFKDANTTGDMMSALAQLYEVWPDARVGERLRETLDRVLAKLIVAPGIVHMFVAPDWTPLPEFARYSQCLHTANLVRGAGLTAGGEQAAQAVAASRMIADWMNEIAWDRGRGGYMLAGSSHGLTYLEDQQVLIRQKYWWPQAEALELLAFLSTHPDGESGDRYLDRLAEHWRFVKREVIDQKRGGWLWKSLDSGKDAAKQPRASRWKDPSHELTSLLHAAAWLEASAA